MYYLITIISFLFAISSTPNKNLNFESKQNIIRVIHYGLSECGKDKTSKGNLRHLKDNGSVILYGTPFATGGNGEWMEIKSFEIEITTPSSKGAKKYTCSGNSLPADVKNLLANTTIGPVTVVFKKIVVINSVNKPKTLEGTYTFVFN